MRHVEPHPASGVPAEPVSAKHNIANSRQAALQLRTFQEVRSFTVHQNSKVDNIPTKTHIDEHHKSRLRTLMPHICWKSTAWSCENIQHEGHSKVQARGLLCTTPACSTDKPPPRLPKTRFPDTGCRFDAPQ